MGFKLRQNVFTKLLLYLTMANYTVIADSQEFLFLGEGKKDEVKLFWLPETWPDSLRGFHVLRRSMTNSKWEKLTEFPIEPGNSVVKSLNNVSNSNVEIERLIYRRNQLLKTITGNRLGEISRPDFVASFDENETINLLSLMFSLDFDIPLLCGFAYYDKNIPEDKKYTYALQKVYNNSESLVYHKYNWNYGDENIFEIKATGEIKKIRKKIKVIWSVEIDLFKKDITLNGFNIYRIENKKDTVRLNTSKIMVNTEESLARVVYLDSTFSDSVIYQYAIAPVNVFNNEGSWHVTTYNIIDNSEKISSPKLNRIITSSNVADQNLHFQWELSESVNPYILGFVVERKADGGNYEVISDTLNVTERKFVDNPGIENRNKHLVYRISVLRESNYPIWSNPYPLLYQPKQQLAVPGNLKAELVQNNGIHHIHLKWTPKQSFDTITNGYVLFTDHGGSYFGREANLPIIKTNHFNYHVDKTNGAEYRFAIAAIDKEKNLSKLSDTIKVLTPTKFLPNLNIWPVEKNQNSITLNWNYPNNISDLAGFRIYMNDQLIVDESILKSNQNSWISDRLQPGKYTFQMTAVSVFGNTSKKSKPRFFTITE